MSDENRLLEMIEEGIVQHGGDLGGWTKLGEDSLQLFDGQVTLRAEVHESERAELVHAHVFTMLHQHDDEVLDACLFGMGEDHEGALAQAATIWITCVAGPIKSFMDNKPVCMTCQAGVVGGDESEGFVEGDYGLPGLRAYVGPSFARGIEDERVPTVVDDSKPWFRYAAESAAPRRVHMAKATIVAHGKEGWRRELEIDGHDVSHQDPSWPAGIQGPDFGYMTRFAVFEFPRNSTEIARCSELERTIHEFVQRYPKYESVDNLTDDMVAAGFDADLVHEVESISTIAFGRMLFETHGVQYSSWVIRAHRDGRVEREVPLMSIPAYSRARAIGVKLRETMSQEDFEMLCLYNAESHAILNAMEAAGDQQLDLSQMTMFPCVVPDHGVSNETMDAAMAILNELVERDRPAKKPWWKFW